MITHLYYQTKLKLVQDVILDTVVTGKKFHNFDTTLIQLLSHPHSVNVLPERTRSSFPVTSQLLQWEGHPHLLTKYPSVL